MALAIVPDGLYALLQEVTEVMERYPEQSSQLRVLLAPEGITLAQDEILVQVVDRTRNIVELHPCKASRVTLDDTDHNTQILDTPRYECDQDEYLYYMETVNGHQNHSHSTHCPN